MVKPTTLLWLRQRLSKHPLPLAHDNSIQSPIVSEGVGRKAMIKQNISKQNANGTKAASSRAALDGDKKRAGIALKKLVNNNERPRHQPTYILTEVR